MGWNGSSDGTGAKNLGQVLVGERFSPMDVGDGCAMDVQASDWAFMIHNKSAADYARFRENTHYRNVCALYAAAMTGLAMGRKKPDTSLLVKLENQDNIFPWIGELL